MRILAALSCAAIPSLVSATVNTSRPLSSRNILPANFQPPEVFENVALVRDVNLEKGYPREKISVVVKNIHNAPQDTYYIPFEADLISRVGGLEVRDKKKLSDGPFALKLTEFDAESSTQFYRVTFPQPLAPTTDITLSITYTVLADLNPLPEAIEQFAQQSVVFKTSVYAPSAYKTLKQRTNIKFPNTNVQDYTVIPGTNSEGSEDPSKQGTKFTYGPYENVPPGATQDISVRYEFTKPLIHASKLERDVEVSHWGGNLATEERFWLENRAAKLKNHFSRVQWQLSSYMDPRTTAMKGLIIPLQPGSMNAYFTDDIGNVSTSKFSTSDKAALLELKPRYPVFGGWKYSFKIGWDGDLGRYLKKIAGGEGHVLKVPFLEGPKMSEGVEYEKVVVRIILPEGARNVQFSTEVPIADQEVTLHKTFMDTVGRPTLKLTAINIVDEWRNKDLVVTYDYPWIEGYRKPLTIAAGMGSIFFAAWVIGNLDTRIGKGT